MSLDAAQRERTAREIAHNLALSGLTHEEAAARAGISLDRFAAAFAVAPAHPADVWLVRDVVETAAREAGQEPVPYTVLTERMRSSAAVWFGVRDRR